VRRLGVRSEGVRGEGVRSKFPPNLLTKPREEVRGEAFRSQVSGV
jgi:hypothetical protein